MEFYCPHCNQRFVCVSASAGQQATCPACSGPATIVSAATPAPAKAAPDELIFCQKCGQQNKENNFKCSRCGFVLHGQTQPQYIITDDNTLGGLIPYKNPKALWAYYLGIFSLIPCLGILLGVAALILGIGGLRHANLHPESRGKAHAWVGIILGSLCAAGYLFLLVLAVISASVK